MLSTGRCALPTRKRLMALAGDPLELRFKMRLARHRRGTPSDRRSFCYRRREKKAPSRASGTGLLRMRQLLDRDLRDPCRPVAERAARSAARRIDLVRRVRAGIRESLLSGVSSGLLKREGAPAMAEKQLVVVSARQSRSGVSPGFLIRSWRHAVSLRCQHIDVYPESTPGP